MLDNSYKLHIAFKGNDVQHVTHSVWVGNAKFALGLTPFNDNGTIYGLLGDFNRDGEWYCFDIPYEEIAARANPVFTNPANFIDNAVAILSGSQAGVGLNFDAIFFYRDKAQGIVGDVTGDGKVDIADVNAVINIMLGKTARVDAADVTGEGDIDIADVNAVINIMLGKTTNIQSFITT